VFSSNVVVAAGGTLGGKGTIGGPVTVNGGGRLSGALVFQTNVTLNATATVEFNLGGTRAAPQFSTMTLAGGTLALGGCTLSVTLGFAPSVGSTFQVIDNTGGLITGQFVQVRSVSATYGGKTYSFRVTYSAGGVTLTALPAATLLYIE
jgi:fibronectin-binding autotransporter adhesin